MKVALLWLTGLWLVLLLVMPGVSAETGLGAAIARGFTAAGAALVLWTPFACTAAAIRRFRRKTNFERK